jgi:uncharacterized membrane protein (UPF0127 family)
MKIVRIFNSTQGNIVCEKCVVADNFWTRGKGLLGRKELPVDEGILLSPGNSIHMFGMKFAIDVVFLTRDDIVTDLVENIAPGKAHIARDGGVGKPFAALELASGKVRQVGLSIGDQLKRE